MADDGRMEPTRPTTPHSRRDVLIGGAAGVGVGALVWTAPVILSTDAASAATVPPAPFAPLLLANDSVTSFLVADSAGQVRQSTDNGATFTTATAMGINPVVMAGFGGTIIAIDSAGVVRQWTGGPAWTTVGTLPATPVVLAADGLSNFIALDASGGSWSSGDLGATWVAGATAPLVPAAAAGASGGVYVGALDQSTQRSFDAGATWGAGGGLGIAPTAMGTMTFGDVYAVDAAGAVRSTSDFGASWAAAPGTLDIGPVALAGASGVLMAVDATGQVRTYDGATWSTPAGNPIT